MRWPHLRFALLHHTRGKSTMSTLHLLLLRNMVHRVHLQWQMSVLILEGMRVCQWILLPMMICCYLWLLSPRLVTGKRIWQGQPQQRLSEFDDDFYHQRSCKMMILLYQYFFGCGSSYDHFFSASTALSPSHSHMVLVM